MTKLARTNAYNPHLMSREDLLAGFIARRPLLDQLVDDLRRGGGQHHLLIGPRGSGKTTLLLRLGHAIDDDAKLARKAIALRFPEEQYNVARLSDFWLNCLDALIDALERRGEQAEVGRLEAALTALEDLEEEERAERSLAVLTTWASKAKQLLVLLVDNLDIVLARLSSDHWTLRKALASASRLVLVGASSHFLDETSTYESAFYDFFNVHELGALSEPEARALLLHLAAATARPRVAEVVTNEPGRFKALLILSGGTPRTFALLHGILAQDSTANAEQDLEALLDQLTPYYKARFDDLPAQSQQVVDALALHWHPMSAAECAAKTRLETNQASAQLNRLVRHGVIEKIAGAEGKLTFSISERFFNIWYLMRASRRLRRKLFWLVAYLQTLYGQAEIDLRAEQMMASAAPTADAPGDPARFLAFAAAVSDPVLRRRLEFHAIQQIISVYRNPPFSELLDLAGEDRHLGPVLDRAQRLRAVRRRITKAKYPWPSGVTAARIADAVSSSWAYPLALKERIARAIESGDLAPDRLPELLRQAEEDRDFLGEELFAATGRGEVPTNIDTRTEHDLDTILQFTTTRSRHRVLVLAAMTGTIFGRDAVVKHALMLAPEALVEVVRVVGSMLPNSGWEAALRLLEPALAIHVDGIEGALGDPRLWKPFVTHGHASAVAQLLEKHSWHDRLLPLYEALRAAAAGPQASLAHLAPEVRQPAEDVLATLLAPAAATTSAPATTRPPPAGRAHAKRSSPDRPKPRPGLAPRKPRPRA